jgi:hypothetical protein
MRERERQTAGRQTDRQTDRQTERERERERLVLSCCHAYLEEILSKKTRNEFVS